jgi:acetylornithine deacetylase/succinyl-diaminopimelate desuccinylase-like protein
VLSRIDRQIVETAENVVREANSRRAPASEPLECNLELIGNRPGGETAADHPLVRAAMEATRLIGRNPILGTASTDANIPISLGIPAIALGAGGRGGDAHTDGEWFENANGALGLQRALGVLAAAAGVAGASRGVSEPDQPSALISE